MDIPMDVPLVDEHQWVYKIPFYIVQESDLPVTLIVNVKGTGRPHLNVIDN